MRAIHRAGGERLGRRELQLRARERADERQALAKRRPRVEVRRQRDRHAGVHERAGRRHRAAEEQRARRQQDGDDVARRERHDPVRAGRLEMVDRPRPELDRERNRT